MPFHADYNRQFLADPDPDGAAKYGVIVTPAAASPGQTYWRCIGVRHLTGAENGGNHHVYFDVLDEQGKRLKDTRLLVSNAGKAPIPVIIDKPLNEAGTNVPMYWNDTLSIWVAGDFPTDIASGFHTRHEDEEPGTTRAHHSFYAAFQRTKAGTTPPPVDPPPTTPGATYTISGPSFYIVSAGGGPIAQVTTQEWAKQIVAGLELLEARKKGQSTERWAEDLDKWNRGERDDT